jgi:hypothetical protein
MQDTLGKEHYYIFWKEMNEGFFGTLCALRIMYENVNECNHCHHPGCGAGNPDEVESTQGAAPDPGPAHGSLPDRYLERGRG